MTSLPELVTASVQRSPDAVAVEYATRRMTYRELDQAADAVAQTLSELGAGPGERVALYLDRSAELVVAILGILKSGAAYVPLDPTHPAPRIARILEDARPLALLTEKQWQATSVEYGIPLVFIEEAMTASSASQASLARPPAATDLAYVIYTSGSTGAPKGVEIEHRSVVNMLESMRSRPGADSSDTLLAVTTVAFDIAVLELFLPLVCGARVVVAPAETVVEGDELLRLLDACGATILQATPSTMRMLLEAGWTGSPGLKVLCGGEAWSADLATEILKRCASLWNMYGPTETTVWSAVSKVAPDRPVVIGRPIANTRLYVLDNARQLVPVGIPGELYIGGEGLARGYHNRSDLTAERFLADPYAGVEGARMYRTGDLVRRLPDGALEFIGRLDDQVKIRGHRIELGEIEAALGGHAAIDRCVVVAGESPTGEQQLVAYYIPRPGVAASAEQLRAALSETLPSYMIPAAFVQLTEFPLTPNGKLDRKALPAPDVSPRQLAEEDRPHGVKEAALAELWSQMLGVSRVGVHDNFFDLGGHSLLATRLIGRINQTFGVHLRVPTFFQNPTIGQLAALLEKNGAVRPEPRLLQLQSGDRGLPLYFIGAGPAEAQIAQRMGEGCAVYVIDIPIPTEWGEAISAGDLSRVPSIEDLGEIHARRILDHAGDSPFVVAGYSMWGRIAFEAARALHRRGANVAFVLLLDARRTAFGGNIRETTLVSWRWIWGGSPGSPLSEGGFASWARAFYASCSLIAWWISRLPLRVIRRLQRRPGTSGYLDTSGAPVPQATIDALNRLIDPSYAPEAIDVRGVLLRAHLAGEENIPGFDPTIGWRHSFTRGLQVIRANGDHHSMMRGVQLTATAGLIRNLLESQSPGAISPLEAQVQGTSQPPSNGEARVALSR